jgi:hypothetical protein
MVMEEYVFVVKIVSKAQWHVQADTLEDAYQRFQALRDEGDPPVEEDIEDSEIITVLEDGVPVPPPGKKRYHVEVEIEGGKKRYEVFAADEGEAVFAGQDRFFAENPDQDLLGISVDEVPAGETEAVEKAWQFRLDVVGFGDDPEEAWENLLLYSLKEPPPCERLPEKDVPLEDDKDKAEPGESGKQPSETEVP